MANLSGIISALDALGSAALSGPVTLGSMQFQGFEVPEVIEVGGDQAMAIQRMAGGARNIQSMGSDPNKITLAGIFMGPNALARSEALDRMRVAGQTVTLSTGGGGLFAVKLRRFTYNL